LSSICPEITEKESLIKRTKKKYKKKKSNNKRSRKIKADLTPGCMHLTMRRSGNEDAVVAVQWSRGNFSFLSIRVCVFKDNETKRQKGEGWRKKGLV